MSIKTNERAERFRNWVNIITVQCVGVRIFKGGAKELRLFNLLYPCIIVKQQISM